MPDTKQRLFQGVVRRAQSGFFWVAIETGIVRCTLRGRLKKERLSTDIAVIGDEVVIERVGQDEGAVVEVLPRRSRFARRSPGNRGAWKEDVLVANLDLIVIVSACTQPAFSPRKIDRMLLIAEHQDVPALLVANKIDLVKDIPSEFREYERIGYPVVYTSAERNLGIDELRSHLGGKISAFSGSSGVGKSSLLNALQPGLQLQTGEISGLLNKGRHTTTVAELHPLEDPKGGYIADTPGIREIGTWEIPAETLDGLFIEFRPFLGECAFNDCSHVHEPDCAVRAAVKQGVISAARYDSYLRLLESVAA